MFMGLLWKTVIARYFANIANTENIYGNGKVTKYECIWGFMVTVIARPLLTLKTYMEMGK